MNERAPKRPPVGAELVWPRPPKGLSYVTQDLPGGSYVSTGWFDPDTIGPGGRGRSVENCRAVTSLFFDADILTFYDAQRLSRGVTLEARASDRKARIYRMGRESVDSLKSILKTEILPELEAEVGCPPTLVLDSGWGLHFHFAVAPHDVAVIPALGRIHAGIVDRVNARVAERLRVSAAKIEHYTKALDRTHDVGARLCRAPGSMNTKASTRPVRVSVVSETATVLDSAWIAARAESGAATPLFDRPAAEAKPSPGPAKASGETPRSVDEDFALRKLPDGRTWRQVVDGLGPGERLKVVCPFGGTSIGSGFFSRDPDGRARYYSAPTNRTYWDTPAMDPSEAPVALVRGPTKKGGEPGAILNTVTNLCAVLADDPAFSIYYDSFFQTERNGRDPIDDIFWVEFMRHIERVYGWTWRPSKELVFGAVEQVARLHARNPVQDYVLGLEWDQQPRLSGWLSTVCGVEASPLHRAYALRWAIGLMARLFQPGCKLDTIMVLAGPQGWHKSTVWKEWANWTPELQLFSDTLFNLKDKDSYIQLYSALIYEDAELAGSSMADQETRKAFLSSAQDVFRPPYGRKIKVFKRHTVIVGTTNEAQFLKDRTGSRRYWVVQVAGPKITDEALGWLYRNRNQLLAEAYARYSAGEQWWLTDEEQALSDVSNGAHQYEDWYTQCARVVYLQNGGGWNNKITAAMFAHAVEPGVSTQRVGMGIASALSSAGFKRRRSNGATFYFKELETIETTEVFNNGLGAITDLLIATNNRN